MLLPNQTPPENLQDVFNRIWQHFVVEKNPPASLPGIGCLYRTPDGNGCFIGCMLPDKMAKKADDIGKNLGTGIASVLNRHPDIKNWFENFNMLELEKLQMIHDSASGLKTFTSQIEEDLKIFAKDWGLNISENPAE